ncbi:hypothetical protein [Streptomyces sp. DH24]|uniref:hypothetical protein n=1 Tax=Streptomyces sp. DH24 TaxID=3040123 RepID=UPI0024425E2C|nr:hypothetical protein [Streptomyces sp. DH24]MDG9716087.1 hypothetical protein [Streptomyces sp. DH24]
MRIRSVLAAALLAAALTATGATTATADGDHDPHHSKGHGGKCDTYFGAIDTETSDLFWGGRECGHH